MAHTSSHKNTQIQKGAKSVTSNTNPDLKADWLSCPLAPKSVTPKTSETKVSSQSKPTPKPKDPHYLIKRYMKDGVVHIHEKLWMEARYLPQEPGAFHGELEVLEYLPFISPVSRPFLCFFISLFGETVLLTLLLCRKRTLIFVFWLSLRVKFMNL